MSDMRKLRLFIKGIQFIAIGRPCITTMSQVCPRTHQILAGVFPNHKLQRAKQRFFHATGVETSIAPNDIPNHKLRGLTFQTTSFEKRWTFQTTSFERRLTFQTTSFEGRTANCPNHKLRESVAAPNDIPNHKLRLEACGLESCGLESRVICCMLCFWICCHEIIASFNVRIAWNYQHVRLKPKRKLNPLISQLLLLTPQDSGDWNKTAW